MNLTKLEMCNNTDFNILQCLIFKYEIFGDIFIPISFLVMSFFLKHMKQ